MATIEVTRPHALGLEEARKRANSVLDKLKGEAGIKGEWKADVFQISSPAKGTFTVSATALAIAIDLPLMLRPMKGKIEERINKEFDLALK